MQKGRESGRIVGETCIVPGPSGGRARRRGLLESSCIQGRGCVLGGGLGGSELGLRPHIKRMFRRAVVVLVLLLAAQVVFLPRLGCGPVVALALVF